MTWCGLEIEVDDDARRPTGCDGCGEKMAMGERYITNIGSCCGGGCVRSLCEACVHAAVVLLDKVATPDVAEPDMERLKKGIEICEIYKKRGELDPGSQAWNIYYALKRKTEGN